MTMNHPYTKLLCYLAAIVLFEFVDQSSDLTSAQVCAFGWWDWLKFSAGLLVPAALVMRAYTDPSLQNHIADQKANGNGKPIVTVGTANTQIP